MEKELGTKAKERILSQTYDRKYISGKKIGSKSACENLIDTLKEYCEDLTMKI